MKSLTLAALSLVLCAPALAEEIEYKTVQEALDDVRDQPGAVSIVEGDWNVFSNADDGKQLLWSFTQRSHYAYPSLARREILVDDEGPYIETSLLCEASEAACGQLVIDYRDLDKALNKRMQGTQKAE